jgi:hypothetical protein
LKSAVSGAASGTDKDQNLADAETKVNATTKSYNTFIGGLTFSMISQDRAEKKKKEIMESLSSKNPLVRDNEFAGKRVSGTGTWFVESNEFKGWMMGSSQVLIGSGNGIIPSIIEI